VLATATTWTSTSGALRVVPGPKGALAANVPRCVQPPSVVSSPCQQLRSFLLRGLMVLSSAHNAHVSIRTARGWWCKEKCGLC